MLDHGETCRRKSQIQSSRKHTGEGRRHFHGGEIVKIALIDTDILSMFFRGNAEVEAHFRKYLEQHERVNVSILTYYELLSGLTHRGATKQIEIFYRFISDCTILAMTEESVSYSARIYAEMRAKGKTIDDIDILIAGIALEHCATLVTHNTRHFMRISGLTVEDWSES